MNRLSLLFLALFIILSHWLPYVVMGKDAYVWILDQLDGVLGAGEVVAHSRTLFSSSDTIVPQYGIPRASFGSEFHLTTILMTQLSQYTALAITLLFINLAGFAGMYLLLQRHLIKSEAPAISIGVATCFAILPYFSFGVLSIAGTPLMLYAFLNLREGDTRWQNWGLLILLPFFSSLVGIGFFFLCMMAALFLYDCVTQKRFNTAFFCGMAVMSIAYLGVEYRLILNTLSPAFLSQRAEAQPQYLSLMDGLRRGFNNYLHGQYHAPSLQSRVIWPVAIAACALLIMRRQLADKQGRLMVGTLLLCGAISLFYGLWYSVIMEPVRSAIPLLEQMNFARFHWLHPLLWYMVFALSLLILLRYLPNRKFAWLVIAAAMVLQLHWVGYKHHEIKVAKKHYGITYRAFFAEDLFARIRHDIGRPVSDYRVASIGMHPSISAHSGFYTADWYLAYYPRESNLRLRKVIAGELAKAPDLAHYYDHWGNRMYLFTSALGKDFFGFEHNTPIDAPEFNVDALRKLGVEYVFSRVEIRDWLPLFGQYTDPNSHWTIWVYQL